MEAMDHLVGWFTYQKTIFHMWNYMGNPGPEVPFEDGDGEKSSHITIQNWGMMLISKPFWWLITVDPSDG